MRRGRRAGAAPALAAAALALTLSACKLGPDFFSPAAPEETGYVGKGEPLPGEAAADAKLPPPQRITASTKLETEWWRLFRSPPLDAVVKEALAGNPTIAQARSTLVSAREQVVAAAGGLLPQVDIAAGVGRQAVNVEVSGVSRSAIPVNVFSIGPTVSYALDVFGGLKRQVEAQQAQADVGEYQLAAAYLSLSGNVALEAITVAGLRGQIETVETILADDQKNVDLVKTAQAGGTASMVDVTQAQSQLANDRTLLPPLRQQLSVANHALAVYVGKTPATWSPPEFDLTALTLPADLPVSLPSQLVRQRPDILAAEANLHAAGALVGVATANLYPNFTLTGGINQQATKLADFFSGAYSAWSIGLGLAAPVFHGGTLKARERAAVATFEAARDGYRETVIQAFGQVADLLEALAHDQQAVVSQKQAADTAQEALRLARLSFQNGNTTLLNVLDSERLSDQARLGLVRAEAQRLLDTAQLFVALGSGWWNTPPNAPVPPPIEAGPAPPPRAASPVPRPPRLSSAR